MGTAFTPEDVRLLDDTIVHILITDGNDHGIPRKVAIICSKGSLDTDYPGLILANAARLMGIQAMVFFTFGGLDIIKEKKIQGLDIPDIRELMETLDAAGIDQYACKTDMDMFGLEQKDLVPEVTNVIGVMDFFQHAEGALTFFI